MFSFLTCSKCNKSCLVNRERWLERRISMGCGRDGRGRRDRSVNCVHWGSSKGTRFSHEGWSSRLIMAAGHNRPQSVSHVRHAAWAYGSASNRLASSLIKDIQIVASSRCLASIHNKKLTSSWWMGWTWSDLFEFDSFAVAVRSTRVNFCHVEIQTREYSWILKNEVSMLRK